MVQEISGLGLRHVPGLGRPLCHGVEGLRVQSLGFRVEGLWVRVRNFENQHGKGNGQ